MIMTAGIQYNVDQKEFWERMFQAGVMPWDIGKAAPPLETFLKSPYAVCPGSIAVLGCGSGHDCMLFARHNFQVTGVDFAPTAIQITHRRFLDAGMSGKTGFLLERDLFSLHDYNSYFNYALEHAFFNSIDRSRRRTYAQKVRDLLKPGGKLIGLWWIDDAPGGPPFGIAKDELFRLFEPFFTLDPVVFTPTNSAPGRQGKELFTLMTRR